MAAVNSILQVENLTKSFGDLVLFENISFGLSEGQRVGLIAKNGSGKSTLLNILSGKEGYDGGTISFRRDIRVGYLEQDPQYPEELTVLEAAFSMPAADTAGRAFRKMSRRCAIPDGKTDTRCASSRPSRRLTRLRK